MKKMLFLGLMALASAVFAQGRVNFANMSLPDSLIYTNSGTIRGPINGPSGSFRFELFSAPDGTSDPAQFTSTGVTNANSMLLGPGRIVNRPSVDPLVGPSGTWIMLQVRGWSANLGNTWAEAQTNALRGTYVGLGWMNSSGISRYMLTNSAFNGPRVFYSTEVLPSGASQIASLELLLVPEPTLFSLALLGSGLGLILLRRRSAHGTGLSR